MVTSLDYSYQQIDPTRHDWDKFSIGKMPYLLVGSNYQINLSNIPVSLFHYDAGHDYHQSVDVYGSSGAKGLKITGGENTIIFFGHVPLNDVKRKAERDQMICTPNPASNFVSVATEDVTVKDIAFFDILGRTMLTHQANNAAENIRFDVSSLPPGIYYLRAGNQMQKFVIQR
jgi:hypothetical protein